MNFLVLLLTLALGWPGRFCLPRESGPSDGSEKSPRVVGMVTRKFVDATRRNWQGTGPRPEMTFVWYPAAPGSEARTDWGDPAMRPLFAPIAVAPEAVLSSESQKYPLVLLSHGHTGVALELMWLGQYLASRGYIVAAVDHHGDSMAEGQVLAQGFLLRGERARDLSDIIDKLLADPAFGAHIDATRIGAAGHSSGGETVIALAGGKFDGKHLQEFCDAHSSDLTCQPREAILASLAKLEELKKTDSVVQEAVSREANSVQDQRIKGVFAMAPAVGEAYTKEGLKPIHIPVHILVGEKDRVTPPATNAQRYAKLLRGARLTVFRGNVGHMTFSSECTPLGMKTFDGCRDGEGVDRSAVHRRVVELAYEFFEQALARK